MNALLLAIVMVFAKILSRQAVQIRSDDKHGEHHRDGWCGQGEVPRPPPAAEPGVRPGRQDDPKSTLGQHQSISLAVDTINDSRYLKYVKRKKAESNTADLQLKGEYDQAT